ncbi:MAG: hypothetical protein P8P30_04320 [Rickettsiales bacterium]|nr:hypothetical protein [Rickettsiales bacterium]
MVYESEKQSVISQDGWEGERFVLPDNSHVISYSTKIEEIYQRLVSNKPELQALDVQFLLTDQAEPNAFVVPPNSPDNTSGQVIVGFSQGMLKFIEETADQHAEKLGVPREHLITHGIAAFMAHEAGHIAWGEQFNWPSNTYDQEKRSDFNVADALVVGDYNLFHADVFWKALFKEEPKVAEKIFRANDIHGQNKPRQNLNEAKITEKYIGNGYRPPKQTESFENYDSIAGAKHTSFIQQLITEEIPGFAGDIKQSDLDTETISRILYEHRDELTNPTRLGEALTLLSNAQDKEQFSYLQSDRTHTDQLIAYITHDWNDAMVYKNQNDSIQYKNSKNTDFLKRAQGIFAQEAIGWYSSKAFKESADRERQPRFYPKPIGRYLKTAELAKQFIGAQAQEETLELANQLQTEINTLGHQTSGFDWPHFKHPTEADRT